MFLSVPLVLVQFFKIFVINERNLALREWNGLHKDILSEIVLESS